MTAASPVGPLTLIAEDDALVRLYMDAPAQRVAAASSPYVAVSPYGLCCSPAASPTDSEPSSTTGYGVIRRERGSC